MKRMAERKNILIVLAGVLVIAAIAFAVLHFSNTQSNAANPAGGFEAAIDSNQGADLEETVEEEEFVAKEFEDKVGGGSTFSAYQVLMSTEELIEQSSLVIYGRVTRSDIIYIKASSGSDDDVSVFTDFYVQPTSVLRGEPVNKDEILVRMHGGNSRDHGFICGFMEPLSVGDDYLLFLYKPETGGIFEVKDDHYYIMGFEQGVYEVSSSKSIVNLSGDKIPAEFTSRYEERTDTELDFRTFQSQIEEVNVETPAHKDLFKDWELENLESNLESGFMSQEEYDYYTQVDVYNYATIVEDYIQK